MSTPEPLVREAGPVNSWRPLSVQLPPYMREALAQRCNTNGRSTNAEVLSILAEALGCDLPKRVRFPEAEQVNSTAGGSHAA